MQQSFNTVGKMLQIFFCSSTFEVCQATCLTKICMCKQFVCSILNKIFSDDVSGKLSGSTFLHSSSLIPLSTFCISLSVLLFLPSIVNRKLHSVTAVSSLGCGRISSLPIQRVYYCMNSFSFLLCIRKTIPTY